MAAAPLRRAGRAAQALAALAAAWSLGGCLGFADAGPAVLTPAGRALNATLVALPADDYYGLSDLTVEAAGPAGPATTWAVPEQQRMLVQVQDRALGPRVHPILGIDDAFDTESATSLGGGRFALGTETMEAGRERDIIFIVAPAGDASGAAPDAPLSPVATRTLPYALWGVRAAANEGLEGLCAAGGLLLAASESRGTRPDGGRYAPLGRFAADGGPPTPLALPLSMPTGRISALQCRVDPGCPQRLEVLAIERHFGVGHVLHFYVPREGTAAGGGIALLEPTVLLDLPALVQPSVNFEGIVWTESGGLQLITDNHMGFVGGPTYLLTLPEAAWRAGLGTAAACGSGTPMHTLPGP